MKLFNYLFLIVASILTALSTALAGNTVHTTWLWHLHQPIYWPDRRVSGPDHYENAWDTIQQQNALRPHPSPEKLNDIFGLDDRKAAYQSRPRDTINSLLGYANAGAQVSYSGALMENVQSLGIAGQLGYGGNWNAGNREARGWSTSGGKPRMDLVNFTYHHALAPLISDETLEMELRIHKRQMEILWGSNPAASRGYFPAETCFSEHMIPILNKVGIAWSIVANNHLIRSCVDFPLALGSGGENCDIPNPADQINPAQGKANYQRLSIERGCSPSAAMPFAFQLHYARYVDPATGAESKIIVVPADQAMGWRDSYSSWDLGLIAPLAARNNPAQPALVLCAHDGDNAWSGGYSYYGEWVPNMAGTASSDGYEPTTVEQFIAEFPPNSGDVVHIEDGGWVFADGDFGSPMFINWHWPPSTNIAGLNVVDPSLGVSDKADNWRVIIATENRVKTAQQMSGISPNIDQVRDPGSYSGTPNGVELAWHYYLGSLDSGFVYYGCHDDECQRAVVAQSNSVRNTSSYLSNLAGDTTPPTMFPPQRHPWNPGGTNFGVQYGYHVTVATNSDFWVWTYAYDVSGITNVSLKFRVNGTNPPASDQFRTYAGGPLSGPWQISNMSQRIVAPVIGASPQFIADYYYSRVTGISNAFVDYYVTATDSHGNTCQSPIQHVWVGAGVASNGSGGGGPVTVSPAPPVVGTPVTIRYAAAARGLASASQVYLHLGWNNYSAIVSPDVAMTFNSASNWWQCTVTVANNAANLNCCFNNGTGTWDNNGGANWNFSVDANSTPLPPPAPAGLSATVASASQINLSWTVSGGATGYIVNRDGSPIATNNATTCTDSGLSLNSTYCYTIIATNSVGNSQPTASQCLTIQTPPTPASFTAAATGTNQISLSWSAASGAVGYFVSRDGSTVASTAGTNYSDTGLAANSMHSYTVTATNIVGSSAPTASQSATTLAVPINYPPFVMDGVLDSTNFLVASSGMTIYAALRGSRLYVATWSPGTSGPNDHFIFVSDQLLVGTNVAAPWAKAGRIAVASNKPFLAGESMGTYVSWYNAPAGSQAAKSATSSGAMEGTLDLVAAFGSMPASLYLCVAAYQTADGGTLAAQCPAGSGLDIETNEFFVIPTIALRDHNGDGIFDRADPKLDFILQGLNLTGSNAIVNWASMPGRSYRVLTADLPFGPWTQLAGSQTNAGPMQLQLNFGDTFTPGVTQRFYRVQLIP